MVYLNGRKMNAQVVALLSNSSIADLEKFINSGALEARISKGEFPKMLSDALGVFQEDAWIPYGYGNKTII